MCISNTAGGGLGWGGVMLVCKWRLNPRHPCLKNRPYTFFCSFLDPLGNIGLPLLLRRSGWKLRWTSAAKSAHEVDMFDATSVASLCPIVYSACSPLRPPNESMTCTWHWFLPSFLWACLGWARHDEGMRAVSVSSLFFLTQSQALYALAEGAVAPAVTQTLFSFPSRAGVEAFRFGAICDCWGKQLSVHEIPLVVHQTHAQISPQLE